MNYTPPTLRSRRAILTPCALSRPAAVVHLRELGDLADGHATRGRDGLGRLHTSLQRTGVNGGKRQRGQPFGDLPGLAPSPIREMDPWRPARQTLAGGLGERVADE